MSISSKERIKWALGALRKKNMPIKMPSLLTTIAFLIFVFVGVPLYIIKWIISRTQPSAIKAKNIFNGFKSEYKKADDEVSLLQNGFSYIAEPISFDPRPKSVVYLAYNSLPYHSAGYATRTQGLASSINQHGYDAVVMTRLGYPQIFQKFRNNNVPDVEEIDGVSYHRLNTDVTTLYKKTTSQYLERNVKAVQDAIEDVKPSIIHAASDHKNGLTGNAVAKSAGIPSIYEVRGLWEITSLSKDPAYEKTMQFRQQKHLETQACIDADRVITITRALKDELVSRGVSGEKISVVPNGVDTSRFEILPKDKDLTNILGIPADNLVIGYVGSILQYEGIDDLLHAVKICRDKGVHNFSVLIVGDGAYLKTCQELCTSLDLDDCVIFTGRVPFAKVKDYYSLIDVTPFPRKSLPVCEMVSPIKPFESMAMAKCIIVSSVAALSEIVQDGKLGYVFEKGNINDFADKIVEALDDPAQRKTFGKAARKHAIENHDWQVITQRVADIYDELLGQ